MNDAERDLQESAADDDRDRYMVPALERGLHILGEFSRHRRTLSAPELARRFNLPRSTVFRLLTTLEAMGYLERADNGRDYRLGMAVLRLGFEYLASLELTQIGAPLLNRLCDELGYPCNLVVRDGREIVYVAKVTPPTPFVSTVTIGTRLPAHATVLGQVLLGDLSSEELRALYPDDELKSYSANTPKTVDELSRRIATARDMGYAVSEGFFESHISTIAAPVRDDSGHVIAALGLTVTAAHIDDEKLKALVLRVRMVAEELSRLLNYAPDRRSHLRALQRNRATQPV